MAEQLSVAILGAGQIAGGYDSGRSKSDTGIYSHAGAYRKDGRFLLKTICDTDPERAAAFRDNWSVAAAATSPEEVIGSYHDVVSVCTPDRSHFGLLMSLIERRACKTIFAEKPLALELDQISEVERLAAEQGINVVVNFQRRFDPAHRDLRDALAADPGQLLAGSALYIKGLEHIGVTMIDTLTFLCGPPREVYAFNRVFNRQVEGYSYEFVLFYDGFNITVKTPDTDLGPYHYHIFEIDLLLADRRVTVNDNSRQMVTRGIVDYAYSGVKVLNDQSPEQTQTGYALSMVGAVDYLFRITRGETGHSINTPAHSYLNKLIVDKIALSYQKNTKIQIGATQWKK